MTNLMVKLRSNLKYLLLLNLLIIPFLTCGMNEQSPFELIKLVSVCFFTILTVCLYLAIEMRTEQLQWKWNTGLTLLGILFLAVLTSTLLSTNKFTSFWGNNNTPSDSMLTTLVYMMFSFLLVQLIENKNDLIKFAYVLIVSAFFLASYGIIQHFGYDWVDWWGYRDMHINAYGTIGQAVGYSSILGSLFPLCVMIYFTSKTRLANVLSGLAVGVIGLGILYSGSRTPSIASMIMAAFGATVYLIKNYNRSTIKKYLLWVGVIAAVQVIYFSGKNTALTQKMQSDLVAHGLGERQHIWKEALLIWKKYPYFGSGPETFALELKQVNGLEHNNYQNWALYWHKAHNHFVHYLATIGLFGLAAHLLLCVFAIMGIYKYLRSKTNTDIDYYGLAFLLGFGFIYGSNLTAFNFIITQLYVYIFISLAFIISSSFQPRQLKFRCPKFLNITNMVLLCTILLMFGYEVFKFWHADSYFSSSRKRLVVDNNLMGAIEDIDKAIVIKSNDQRFYFRKATLVLAAVKAEAKNRPNFDYGETVKILNDITQIGVDLDPANAESWFFRGRIFADLYESRIITNPVIAERSFLEAHRVNPVNPHFTYNLGLLYVLTGNLEGFLTYMRKTIYLKQDYLQAHYQLLAFYYRTKDQVLANRMVEVITKVKLLNGEFVNELNNLAKLAQMNGDLRSAQIIGEMYNKNAYLLSL